MKRRAGRPEDLADIEQLRMQMNKNADA